MEAAAARLVASSFDSSSCCSHGRPSSHPPPTALPQQQQPSRAGSLIVVCLILACTVLMLEKRQEQVLLFGANPHEAQQTTAANLLVAYTPQHAHHHSGLLLPTGNGTMQDESGSTERSASSAVEEVEEAGASSRGPERGEPEQGSPAQEEKQDKEDRPCAPVAEQRPAPPQEEAAAAAVGQGGNSSSPRWPFPVVAFWHIGESETLMWRLVVREQLQRIQRSSLLSDPGKEVRAFFVGDYNSVPNLREPRIPVQWAGPTTEYEYATLRKLEAYCQDTPEARVIYFHTKGSTHPLTEPKGWFTYYWRLLLEHFVIDDHDHLLAQLTDASNYTAAGPMYYVSPFHQAPHFSGNFWAARCSYINTVKRVADTDVSDRMLAEFYVGTNHKDFRYKDCWKIHDSDHCNPNTYACNYDESLYQDFHGCGRPEDSR